MKKLTVLLLAVLLVGLGLTRANAVSSTIVGVSVNPSNTATGNAPVVFADPQGPQLSSDGRFFIFISTATNLVPQPTGGFQQLFVRDLSNGTTQMASLNAAATAGGGNSVIQATISPNGRYVAFLSNAVAGDYVAGAVDTNAGPDIFVRDLTTGVTKLVTINSAGTDTGNLPSGAGPMFFSVDGRYLVYGSYAENLTTTTDLNSSSDVFRWDNQTNTNVVVSTNAAGTATSNGASVTYGGISDDGSRVVFDSTGSNVSSAADANAESDVFVHDFNLGVNIPVSVDTTNAATGNTGSAGGMISADGSVVAFSSTASNITNKADTNGNWDAFARNINTGTTQMVSVNASGNAAQGAAAFVSHLSRDGRFVTFTADGDNVTALSRPAGTTQLYERDLVNPETIYVSLNAAGTTGGNGNSTNGFVSSDGRFVGFTSAASDLTFVTDTNNNTDVFVFDNVTRKTQLISHNSAGTASAVGVSQVAALSQDGRTVVFYSQALASNLVSGLADPNGVGFDAFAEATDIAPVANNDTYTTNQDTALTTDIPGVLLNDTDADGDPLTAILVSNVAHGTLTLNSNGSFTYTPTAGYFGPDSFTYRASDGVLVSNVATATINVVHVNHAPVGVADSYSVAENGTLSVPAGTGVVANDTDVDPGDVVTVGTLVSDVAHGTLTLNANGSFVYVPTKNFTGTDTFTYRPFDGTDLGNVTTATITVGTAGNRPPTVVDDFYNVQQGGVLTVTAANGILSNDSDPDGNTFTATMVVTTGIHGTITVNSNGSFTYTPTAGFRGLDTFTYHAVDSLGALSNMATVAISVGNNAPVGVNDTFSITPLNTTLTVPAPGVLGNDTDADGDPLTVGTLVQDAGHGSLTLNPNGSFTYTPELNFAGVDTFKYRPYDGIDLGSVATVTITVNPVGNRPPVAEIDLYSVPQNGTLVVNAADGLLANDFDPDGDSFTVTGTRGLGTLHGTITVFSDGSFTYVPNAGFSGTDDFQYQITDSNNAVSDWADVQIEVGNNPPVANNDTYTVAEDATLTVAAPGVLANDTDVDGDTLTVASVISQPQHGKLTLNSDGSFVYKPDANYNGPDSFTYRAYDGKDLSGVATVSITVTAVNDAPVAKDDAYTVTPGVTLTVSAPGVLSNDTDVDGDALTAALVSNVSNGTLTLNSSGGFTYTANAGFSGTDTFTYHAFDGTAFSNTATVTITVPNAAPVAGNDTYTTPEDAPLAVSAPGVLANDTDANGDALTAVLASPPAHGSVTLNSNGSFLYTPAPNFNGTDSFTYRASDGKTVSLVATVTLTVTPVNDAPVGVADDYSTPEDTTLTVTGPGVLGNDTDVDGDPLTATLVSTTTHGTLTLNGNGSFTYVPAANFNGTDSFTYKPNDGTTTGNTTTVTIHVLPVNDAPVASDDSYTTAEDTTLTVAAPGVLANDTDIDGDTLTAKLVDGTKHGTLTLNANGSFTYVPDANYHGPDAFTYTAFDGATNSSIAHVSLTITSVNDAPVANNDSYSTPFGTTITVAAPGVLSNDTDVDGDALTAVLVSTTANGTLTLNSDGSFTYTPNVGFSGTDTFTYVASDGITTSNTATVSIGVSPTPPPSTPGATVNGAGTFILGGKTAQFNFNTKVSNKGVASGSLNVKTGPKAKAFVSTKITAVILTSFTHARIFGKGKFGQNGTILDFIADVDDLGLNGLGDGFTIIASDGTSITVPKLKTGDIDIEPK